QAGSGLLCVELPPLLPPWSLSQESLSHYFQPAEEALFEPDEEVGGPSLADEDQDADEVDEVEFVDEDQPQASDVEITDDEEAEPTLLLDPPAELDRNDGLTWERLQLTYAAVVTCVDDLLGKLLDRLEQNHQLDDTVLLLTAERGVALGEHGIVGDARP